MYPAGCNNCGRSNDKYKPRYRSRATTEPSDNSVDHILF